MCSTSWCGGFYFCLLSSSWLMDTMDSSRRALPGTSRQQALRAATLDQEACLLSPPNGRSLLFTAWPASRVGRGLMIGGF